MKIALCNPYAQKSSESKLTIAISRLLNEYGHDVSSTMCDGFVSSCDRQVSPELGLRRRMHECFSCIKEQSSYYSALGANIINLSSYLEVDDSKEIFQLVAGCPTNNLSDLSYEGENVVWLARHSLKARYGSIESALKLGSIEKELRDLMIGTIRIVRASKKLLESENPDLSIVVGRDIFAEAFALSARKTKSAISHFIYNPRDGLINITHPTKNEVLQELVPELETLKIDSLPEAWPPELFDSVREILLFLNVPVTQLALFTAQQA